jgi:hypothetical protein
MKETIYGPGGFDSSKPNNNVVEEVELPDVAIPVPDAASPATIRIALRRRHGVPNSQLDFVVDSVIDSIPDLDEREDARTLWTYSVSIRRDHPLVAAVAASLSLTSADIDEVFRLAATI